MQVLSHHEIQPTLIRSVSRAAQLLAEVARHPGGVSGTAAAGATGLAVPTAHHLLATLCAEGLLARGAERRYVLGPAVAVLADAYARGDAVPAWLTAPLHRLAAESGETAYLSAWRGEQIHVLASIEGARAVRVAGADPGAYRSPHARATGKLLLAHASGERRRALLGTGPLDAVTEHTIVDRVGLDAELEAIRAQGWAEDHEEFAEGVCCVAAPAIRDGVVVAAYTVSAPAHNFDRRRAELVDAVQRAAAAAARATTEEQEAQ